MFEKRKKHAHKFDVTLDNVAVPEVHTHEEEPSKKSARKDEVQPSVTYDSVAIPEIHIRKK